MDDNSAFAALVDKIAVAPVSFYLESHNGSGGRRWWSAVFCDYSTNEDYVGEGETRAAAIQAAVRMMEQEQKDG